MIELKIEGVCKECPFRELTLNNYDETVKCKHVVVCKFISDPQGAEALEKATELLQMSLEKALHAASERNADA